MELEQVLEHRMLRAAGAVEMHPQRALFLPEDRCEVARMAVHHAFVVRAMPHRDDRLYLRAWGGNDALAHGDAGCGHLTPRTT